MSRSTKTVLALLLLVLIFVVVPHGVVVPRFLWEDRLQALQSQYPGEEIQVRRVVLALSLNPHIMLSEISVNSPARQEKVELGLLKVGASFADSIRSGRLQINSISLKGLNVESTSPLDCSSLNYRCFPALPATLAARGFQGTQFANPGFFTPQVALQQLEIEQANFLVSNPALQQQFSGKIEQLKIQLGGTEAEQQFSLGWRVGIKSPGIDNQMYIAMNARPRYNPDGELVLNHLKMNLDGNWGDFPWTGTAEQDELRLAMAQANNGEGAPILKMSGINLRTYIRRDDLPETHQAAFSAQHIVGGLPAQNWALKKAEWTFTHEDANAWTFDVDYDASAAAVSISPALIQGSEGLPAEQQTRLVNCDSEARQAGGTAMYWFWENGWFRIQQEKPEEKATVVLCPVLGQG